MAHTSKWPWNLVYFYNTRTQADTGDYNTLSADSIKRGSPGILPCKIVHSEQPLGRETTGLKLMGVGAFGRSRAR